MTPGRPAAGVLRAEPREQPRLPRTPEERPVGRAFPHAAAVLGTGWAARVATNQLPHQRGDMRPVVLEAGAHFRSGELSGGDDGDQGAALPGGAGVSAQH